MAIKYRHDTEVDAMYIYLSNKSYSYTKVLDNTRHIDYDVDDIPIGVELLCVSDGISLEDLPQRNEIEQILEKEQIRILV